MEERSERTHCICSPCRETVLLFLLVVKKFRVKCGADCCWGFWCCREQWEEKCWVGTERAIGQRRPACCSAASELASRQMRFYCFLCRKLCESCTLFLEKKIQLLFLPCVCVGGGGVHVKVRGNVLGLGSLFPVWGLGIELWPSACFVLLITETFQLPWVTA